MRKKPLRSDFWIENIPERISPLGGRIITSPGYSRAHYAKLLRKWYLLLEQDGFADCEVTDPKTGLQWPRFRSTGTTAYYSSENAGDVFRPDKVEYFRYCRAFLAHANFKQLFAFHPSETWPHSIKFTRKLRPTRQTVLRYIFTRHVEHGDSYRKISRLLKTKFGMHVTQWWTHTYIQKIVRKMWAWHKTHREGLDNPKYAE